MSTMKPSTAVIAALGLLLATSAAGNAYLGQMYLAKRDEAIKLGDRLEQAQTAAKACSDGVDKLRTDQEAQHKAAMAAIAAARKEAQKAYGAADAERTREQAVPGDACASAEVETREWLQRRRAAK